MNNDNQPLQFGTGCETEEKVNVNETEIKIKNDYTYRNEFESIVLRKDCSSEFISRKNADKQSNLEENTLKCKFCCKALTDKCNTRHIKICSEKPTFTCDMCKQSFYKKKLLITHILNHSKDKSKKCGNKSYDFSSSLETHKLVHTGENPYNCVVCNKLFSVSTNLNIHMRTHTGEKPYNCDICNKAFFTSLNLKMHKMIHTGGKPYNCDVCNKSFPVSSALNRHMRTHTGEKPIKCKKCSKTFTRKYRMKKHIMNIHFKSKP
ncbi:hypothetical protein AGLY_012259 [Aphis glycines]|uniref:C2H2-type domain-containing protein n=1 Tax=Aphis glycines TaxID=307491 RepID=A0A6G0TBR8_APHGL|nr:hypothetical protein AGLY_012259 [Aphis glycines]